MKLRILRTPEGVYRYKWHAVFPLNKGTVSLNGTADTKRGCKKKAVKAFKNYMKAQDCEWQDYE